MASIPSSRALATLFATVCWLLCSWGFVDALYILRPYAAMVNTPAPRLEIRDLMSDQYSATLFIRTLLNLQARPDSRLTSYTSMASIHGSPAFFDGVTDGTNGQNGYCAHSQLFFGPWHRPYLMMIEQAIYQQAIAFAIQYRTADRDSYVAAARAMRLPYWDWGLKGGQVPSIFLQPTFVVTLPNGASQTVRNPLNQYTIPDSAAAKYQVPDSHRSIFRSWSNPSETLGNIVTKRSQLVSMFSSRSFSCFINRSGTGCTNIGTLEDLHNDLHVEIGGDGHMSDIGRAAFDPIFWLHHCNVDRQLSIWEGLYPEVDEGMGSIADQPAYPFRKSETEWWTTRDVMNAFDTSQPGTRQFGYYYPEFANAAVTPEELNATVYQLYDDTIPGEERTFISLSKVNASPVDGTATIALTAQTPAGSNVAKSWSRAEAAGTTRRTGGSVVKVEVGSVPIFTPDASTRRFPIKSIIVDVTEAVAKIRAVNPAVTNVNIVATITPFDSNGTQATGPVGGVVDLGVPVISTVVDGQVVSRSTPNQIPAPAPAPAPAPGPGPVIVRSGADVPANSDASLFSGEGTVKAVVQG